ncbi:MFS transporter [Paenibacillus cremeus]|uniref:MFS transporter n=1 Tax=Paenibacillus cremeus TaxID=2163881 RepID=UPI0016460DB2|nr:MFS transporter [Paenibacillus cremeus]
MELKFVDKINAWLGSHASLRLLQMSAFIRSICQGIAVVVMSLYLKELGWNAGAVGGLLVASGVFRTVVTSFAGELVARLGSKRYLLLFEALTAAAALLITFTTNTIALCAAVIVAGFGMGHTGSGGPISPIERRWLGAFARKNADHIYGMNALLGYWGLGIGSLLAGTTPILHQWLPGVNAYRPLFAVIALFSLCAMAVLLKVTGGERKKPQMEETKGAAGPVEAVAVQAAPAQRWSLRSFIGWGIVVAIAIGLWLSLRQHMPPLWSALLPVFLFCFLILGTLIRASFGPRDQLLTLVNLFNSIAVTLASTMSSYWLAARFGASTSMIGLVISASYLMTGLTSLAVIRASKRYGSVKPVVGLQLAGIACVLVMPWVPWFLGAAVLYICCTMFNLGTRGSRSVVMNIQRSAGSRNWQSRLTSFMLRLGVVLWPGAFGHMIEGGAFVLPFYIAATVQTVSTVWFGQAQKLQQVEIQR